jgi:hypothetical protein
LQRHAQEVETKPAEWMPWNYRETLERIVCTFPARCSKRRTFRAGQR